MNGNLPDGADAANYSKVVGVTKIPVTADPTAQVVLKATPWDAQARPGKCALSPEMKILKCYVGDDDTEGFDAIKADMGM